MPKLVDYGGRFSFFEEACFAIVREEVSQRRRRDRLRPRDLTGVDRAVALLRRLLPDSPQRIAEELVWWRLAIAAPTSAMVPPDEVQLDEGPLHHRFAIASHGFVPMNVLHLAMTPPRRSTRDDGVGGAVVEARTARQEQVADEVAAVLAVLDVADLARVTEELHALVDGLGIGVCLGRTTPQAAVAALRAYLLSLG